MFLHKNSFKLVIIGAGSSVFTMRLVGDILSESAIESGEIALVDIAPDALRQAKAGVEKLVRYADKKFVISAHAHFSTALPHADFVFLTYAIGGIASWKKDIEICSRYGVNQSVGDTIGPGGVIRALRTIPLTMQVMRGMETSCPDAYAINYVNPEAAQCLAIQKYSHIRAFGLCHGTVDTAADLAKHVFHVEPNRFQYEAAGINHLTWFTRMRIDGADVYPQLRQALERSGYAQKEPISAQLFDMFSLYPAPGDRHVGEFFTTFLRDNVIRKHDYTWKNNDFIAVDQWRCEGESRLQSAMRGEGLDHFMEGSGETATHFIRALTTNEITCEMVNVINQGYIDNISDGIIVEVPAYVDGFGLHCGNAGALPAGIAAKCEMLGREYQLLVDAAIGCDKQLARQAMYIDPLCANSDDPDGLLDALLLENKDLLPQEWRLP